MAKVKEAQTPKEIIYAVVDGAFEWAELHPEQVALMILLYYLCCSSEEYRNFHTKIRVVGLERLCFVVSKLYPERSNWEVRKMGSHFQRLITSYLLDAFTISSSPELEKLKKELKHHIEFLLNSKKSWV